MSARAAASQCRHKVPALVVALGLLLASGSADAQFTTEQETAFGLATGGVLAGSLNDLIAGFLAALLFIGVGILAFAAYQRWADGDLSSRQVAGLLLRASVLITVAGIFLR